MHIFDELKERGLVHFVNYLMKKPLRKALEEGQVSIILVMIQPLTAFSPWSLGCHLTPSPSLAGHKPYALVGGATGLTGSVLQRC